MSEHDGLERAASSRWICRNFVISPSSHLSQTCPIPVVWTLIVALPVARWGGYWVCGGG